MSWRIQDYYTYEMRVNKLSANTVIHRHANIRKALQYAMKIGLIDSNPADLVERPKKGKYVGGYYNESELEQLFEAVKGDPLELAVIVAAFYGLRGWKEHGGSKGSNENQVQLSHPAAGAAL